MRTEDLLNRLEDRPFKPFRVHITDGTTVNVVQPGMVLVGESTAVLPSMWGNEDEGRRIAKRWRTVALAHMTQFSDLDATPNGGGGGGRRRRK